MNKLIIQYKLVGIMFHLPSLKCMFYTCPCTIMVSFSMTSLKEIPTMFNAWFLIKSTKQPIEGSWTFKLTYVYTWLYPMFIEFDATSFQWIIYFIETMLYKMCIMCTIIIDIKMIFFDDMSIAIGAFYIIGNLLSMSK